MGRRGGGGRALLAKMRQRECDDEYDGENGSGCREGDEKMDGWMYIWAKWTDDGCWLEDGNETTNRRLVGV